MVIYVSESSFVAKRRGLCEPKWQHSGTFQSCRLHLGLEEETDGGGCDYNSNISKRCCMHQQIDHRMIDDHRYKLFDF